MPLCQSQTRLCCRRGQVQKAYEGFRHGRGGRGEVGVRGNGLISSSATGAGTWQPRAAKSARVLQQLRDVSPAAAPSHRCHTQCRGQHVATGLTL